MKFLYFGDMHEQPGSPKNRTDDYRATVNAKIAEIQKLGMKHNVRAFLQPGDFLNAPKYNYEFLTEVINRWSSIDLNELMRLLITGKVTTEDVSNRLKEWTPILGAVGNHELYGESMSSYPKTSLAFLESIGFMHFPTQDKPFIFKDENGFTVAITATNYNIGMDSEERLDDYIVKEKKGDIHIHIVHGYLTNRDMGDMFPHTVLDRIAKLTKADLTVTGHDHMGFPLTEVDGKLFVNPGAPVRLKNDKKEMKRRPKVLLIEASKEAGLTVKSIYLKSAKAGADVLSREEIESKHSLEAKMEEIKSIVNKANVKSGNNITEVIASIADNNKIDKAIKEKSVELVTGKMDKIKRQTQTVNPYKIEKIVLENFQSHVNTELEVSDGLNVFVGESGAGKSAIMRALSWVFENDGKNPRRRIHRGKDFSRVSLYLSNGMVVSRYVEKKAHGKNGYEVYDPATGEVSEHNTKSLPLIQELLGFTKLDIDTDKPIPLNFQRQGEGWFFIGDGFSPSTRAKLIGAVYQTHFVDAVIKDLESDTKKLKTLKEDKESDLTKTMEKMTEFEHLPKLKHNIELLEEKMAQLAVLENKKSLLKDKYDTMCHIKEEINTKEDIVFKLKYINGVQEKLMTLNQRITQRSQLNDKINRLNAMKAEANQAKVALQKLSKIETAFEKMTRVHELIANRKVVVDQLTLHQSKSEELTGLNKEVERLTKQISSLSYSNEVEEKLNRIHALSVKRELLVLKVTELKEVTMKGVSYKKQNHSAKADIIRLTAEYEVLLKKMGTCPVCKSTVNEQKNEHILTSHVG